MSDSIDRQSVPRKRSWVALASYWMLLIATPLAWFFYGRGFSLRTLGEGTLLLVALVMIGEHLFRLWSRRFVD